MPPIDWDVLTPEDRKIVAAHLDQRARELDYSRMTPLMRQIWDHHHRDPNGNVPAWGAQSLPVEVKLPPANQPVVEWTGWCWRVRFGARETRTMFNAVTGSYVTEFEEF